MTSPRRRPVRSRAGLSAALVLLVIAVAGYALHGAGPGDGADTAAGRGGQSTAEASTSTTVEATTGPTAEPVTTRPSGATATTSPTAAGVPGPSRASSPPPATTDAARARALLAALPVKGKAPATGYDRTGEFGSAWLDVDRNGCDTRNDVLARDLTDVVRSGPCRVLSGELVSPYTGGTIDFVRGDTTSTRVQIDHVVALENAWRTGAQALTQDEREALANDPDNLFAVDQHSNAQKRSGDAATWLPAATAFRCTYVGHQVSVKTRYRLWVAPAERDAIARVLALC